MFLGHIYYDHNSYILYRQHGNNVVGAKTTFKTRMRSRIKSLRHLFNQHENEQEAKELLKVYGDMLSDIDVKLISIVAYYKDSLMNRLKWLIGIGEFNRGINRKNDNIWLKLRILLGTV